MSKKWTKAAIIRAIKTVCQTAIATIGINIVTNEINWLYVLLTSIFAGILSILTSLGGLPEVKNEEEINANITERLENLENTISELIVKLKEEEDDAR